MADAVRRTQFTVDIHTREVTREPDEPLVLYRGDRGANQLHFVFTNQGRPVDTINYRLLIEFVRPDQVKLTDEVHILRGIYPDGPDYATLCYPLPAAVYAEPGEVQVYCTLVDDTHVVTSFELKLNVRDKIGLDYDASYDLGSRLPTYAEILQLILQLEMVLGLADPDNPAQETLYHRLAALEAHMHRTVGFATAAQGQAADAALPAAVYTSLNVLNKLCEVDGHGSGLDADTLDGLHAADLATPASVAAAQGTANAAMTAATAAQGTATAAQTAAGTAQTRADSAYTLASGKLRLVVQATPPAADQNVLWVKP